MIANWLDFSMLALFVSASLALILAPGPASFHVLTESISGGYRGGFAATFGTCTGLLVHTNAAMLGLSAILRASAAAYTMVKYLGAAYLLYLGIQTLRNEESFDLDRGGTETNTPQSYRQGVLINTLNPKVAVFFIAFLPQFVATGPGTSVQLLLLGVFYTMLAFSYQSTLVLVSSKVRAVLRARSSITDRIRQLAGTVLVGFGVELALSDHR